MAKTKKSDLALAYEDISNKAGDYNELYSYLDGSPVLKYSLDLLKDVFDKSFVYFSQNWAGVIINAVLDRLILKGFDSGNDTTNIKLNDLFTKKSLNLDAQDVHEALQVTGEAFLIVDKTDSDIDIYFNDPGMCTMFYDADRPKVKAYAAKKWTGSDGLYHINLYYPDRTEKYTSEGGQTAGSFQLAKTELNENGIIPVFHFRNSRRIIKGELDPSVISMLDGINQLFANMMASAQFETYRTLIFFTKQNPGALPLAPGMLVHVPPNEGDGQASSVLELQGSNLDNFTKPITELANALAIQTRTPKHFFFEATQAPSGESLLVMESGLVKKVESKQEAYAPEWQALASYVLKLQGIEVKASDIQPIWEPAQAQQPLMDAQVLKTSKEAGIPVVTSARRQGWDETEIIQLEEDMANEPQKPMTSDLSTI
jgi:hypothetical protein